MEALRLLPSLSTNDFSFRSSIPVMACFVYVNQVIDYLLYHKDSIRIIVISRIKSHYRRVYASSGLGKAKGLSRGIMGTLVFASRSTSLRLLEYSTCRIMEMIKGLVCMAWYTQLGL
jgi:hypothetical protein